LRFGNWRRKRGFLSPFVSRRERIVNKVLSKAVRIASKKLPLRSDKAIRANLEFVTDDLAEAYRIGAEEAQREIVLRLRELEEMKPE
jgi:hypothetical protein